MNDVVENKLVILTVGTELLEVVVTPLIVLVTPAALVYLQLETLEYPVAKVISAGKTIVI